MELTQFCSEHVYCVIVESTTTLCKAKSVSTWIQIWNENSKKYCLHLHDMQDMIL